MIGRECNSNKKERERRKYRGREESVGVE